MFTFTGNTSLIATSPTWDIPILIEGYSIVNRDGANNSFNVYKIVGGSQYNISPHDYALQVNGSTSIYESVRPVVILAGQQIQISAQNSLDFDFTLSPMKIDKLY